MAYVALMLLNDPKVGGPTVLVVSDRLDLLEQTQRQFQTAGTPRTTMADTKADLRRLLRERPARDRADHHLPVRARGRASDDEAVLNTRENIIVLVDEAHRTTEGTFGDDMRAALPNARFFGLTGTPVTEKDRNTYQVVR